MITHRSKSFIYTDHKPPKDETAVNAKLLEQAGYVRKLMAGVYTYLPLGFRVLQKINQIIREEMNAIGGQEIYMPAMQPKELWDKTGRWQEMGDIMYQFKDKSDRWLGLATTHEETITEIIKKHIQSYKDLPLYLYQIQDKFRNEPRAKSGLIRCREFSMKDLYSFHVSEKDLAEYYEKAAQAYAKIFCRCGLKAMMIEASGGTFTKEYSHEFQVLSEAGEDHVIHCEKGDFSQNAEISKYKARDACPKCKSKLKVSKGIEVGNIFKLGTKFSQALNAFYHDKDGKLKPIVMASYGIGPGRLMGTIVEVYHDQDGIVWPISVAPYQIYLISLDSKDVKGLLNDLDKNGIEVLYDDRDVSAGIKFKDADLIGLPVRIIASAKTGSKFELKYRGEREAKLLSQDQLIKELKNLK